MRCDDFQERWQSLLDQRQLPQQDASLCDHAATCENCAGILRIQTVLFREIKRSAELRPSLDVASSSMHRVNAQQSNTQKSNALKSSNQKSTDQKVGHRRLINSMIMGLAIAGSLLIIVIPAWRLAVRRSPVAHRQPHVARMRAASERHPGVLNLAVPMQTASMSAEQEALRKLMHNVAAKLSDVPEEGLEPLGHIAGGFRPLANTLGVAWDALLRTIPVGRSSPVTEPQAIMDWRGLQAIPT